ncbi:MAG: hypothetical protein JXB03_03010 [Spirochaetales bacterium]|nr:hypothetical protein [Spirochaetales bacterium]
MLERGADCTYSDNLGETALHEAKYLKNVEVVELLKAAGAAHEDIVVLLWA